jgi:hypothetical protein
MKILEGLFTPADNWGVRKLASLWLVIKKGIGPFFQSFINQVRAMRENGTLEKYLGRDQGNKIIEFANGMGHLAEFIETLEEDGEEHDFQDIEEIGAPAPAQELGAPGSKLGLAPERDNNPPATGSTNTNTTVNPTHEPGEIGGASAEGSLLPVSPSGEAAPLITETPPAAQATVDSPAPATLSHEIGEEEEETPSQATQPQRGRKPRRGNG